MSTVYQLALSVIMLTVLLTGGVLSSRVATAATYYVATDGSGANPGSESQPFQTIDQGMSVLQAGDTLYIRHGTYAEPIGYPWSYVPVPSGTSWDNAITIAGYPGESVVLTGYHAGITLSTGHGASYVIFDNLIIDASLGDVGIFIGTDSHHIRFQNGEVKDSPNGVLVFGAGSYCEFLNSKFHGAFYYGFYWMGHDSIFDGNEVYDNRGYAYHIFNTGANDVSNNIIRNNSIHGNGLCQCHGEGSVILANGSNNQAYNNVIYGNFEGVQIGSSCVDCKVYNNTIYGNIYNRISIESGALNTLVEDNIID